MLLFFLRLHIDSFVTPNFDDIFKSFLVSVQVRLLTFWFVCVCLCVCVHVFECACVLACVYLHGCMCLCTYIDMGLRQLKGN